MSWYDFCMNEQLQHHTPLDLQQNNLGNMGYNSQRFIGGFGYVPDTLKQQASPSSRKMSEFCSWLFVALFYSNVVVVEAFDGGDAVALVTGVLIAVMATCACLGCISKRRSILQQQNASSILQNSTLSLCCLFMQRFIIIN